MQLGTASKWPTERSQSSIDPPAESVATSPKSGIRIAQPFEKGKNTRRGLHPRYAFSISGCSPSIYRVVKPDEQAVYMNLLASHSLFQENPRQYPDNVAALKRLKPLWSCGFETYGWALSDGPSSIGADVLPNNAAHAGVNVPDDDVDDYGVVVEGYPEDEDTGNMEVDS